MLGTLWKFVEVGQVSSPFMLENVGVQYIVLRSGALAVVRGAPPRLL